MSESAKELNFVLPRVMEVVRYSLALSSNDLGFFRSLDSTIENLASESSSTLKNLIADLEGASSDAGFSWERIESFLDSLHDKVEIALDKHSVKDVEQTLTSYMTEVKEKPQLHFDIKVDNSDSHPFIPRLSVKPNSLRSLEDSLRVDAEGRYPQPYEFEIMTQPYPEAILHRSEPMKPDDMDATPFAWVNTKEELRDMIDTLAQSDIIAVDLEHHDLHSFYGLTCLMQVSTRHQDWLVDVIALRSHLEQLNSVFTDPNILKIFHGAFMDVLWLQRDFGVYVVSLFDTYHAAKVLGFPRLSLAYLLERFAGFKASKKYQLADWRIRPLPAPLVHYARADTHFLIHIFEQLKNMLISQGEQKMPLVLNNSRKVASRKFEYTKFRTDQSDHDEVSSIMRNYHINPRYEGRLKQAVLWRDLQARELDESPRSILPNSSLAKLATIESPLDTEMISRMPHLNSHHCNLGLLKTMMERADITVDMFSSKTTEILPSSSMHPTMKSVEEIMKIQEDFLAKPPRLLHQQSKVLSNQIAAKCISERGSPDSPSNLQSITFHPFSEQIATSKNFNDERTTVKNDASSRSKDVTLDTPPLGTLTGEPSKPRSTKVFKDKHQREVPQAFDYEDALRHREVEAEVEKGRKRTRSFDPLGNSGLLKRDKPNRRRTPSGRSAAFTK